MEDGKLKDTAELRRAMQDMIVDSYNEATGYIVDLLTGTTSGPELPEAEIKDGMKAERGEPLFQLAWVTPISMSTRSLGAKGLRPGNPGHQTVQADPQSTDHRCHGPIAGGDRDWQGGIGGNIVRR